MTFTVQEKVLLTKCTVILVAMCILVIVIAVKGEKRMIRDKFIKGFFGWPDVHGDKVPIVARRYKLSLISFSASLIFASAALMVFVYK